LSLIEKAKYYRIIVDCTLDVGLSEQIMTIIHFASTTGIPD